MKIDANENLTREELTKRVRELEEENKALRLTIKVAVGETKGYGMD